MARTCVPAICNQEVRIRNAEHVLMENDNGLILDIAVTEATGTMKGDAALNLLDRRLIPRQRVTLTADTG